MLVVTTENVPGHRVVATKGQCFGVVVRGRGIGGNIIAGLRSIVGGEIHEYTQLLEEARRHAVDRLVKNSQAMGANAVVMMRWERTSEGFVDPGSGDLIAVYYDPGSGERMYVRDRASKS